MGEGSTFQVGVDAPRHYQDQVAVFMQPISAALVSAVVAPGDRVLDVACGTGIATRLAAARVGASGRVVGSDLNEGMLEYAEIASAEDSPHIEWGLASALDLPYESGSFDRVICQQGVQFFPDPAAGLAEMGRVAAVGGTVAATVWSELETTPYFQALAEVLIEYAGVEPSEIAFTATKEQIVEWFSDAQLQTPDVELIEEEVELPPIAEYFPAHMRALPWAPDYFGLDASAQKAAIAAVENHMREYQTPTGVKASFGSYLAKASV